MGIRGSIEVARIGEDLFGEDEEAQKAADVTLTEMASLLGCGRESARNLVQTLWEDQQVQFIWSLFNDVTPSDNSGDDRELQERRRERGSPEQRGNAEPRETGQPPAPEAIPVPAKKD
jgi:hypothetical protein